MEERENNYLCIYIIQQPFIYYKANLYRKDKIETFYSFLFPKVFIIQKHTTFSKKHNKKQLVTRPHRRVTYL